MAAISIIKVMTISSNGNLLIFIVSNRVQHVPDSQRRPIKSIKVTSVTFTPRIDLICCEKPSLPSATLLANVAHQVHFAG